MIHPTAIVHANCWVGEDTKVWQFASIIRKAKIGENSTVGACAVVDGSRIGARARIGHGAQIHPGVVAGSDLFLGPGAIICNDLWPWLEANEFDIEGLVDGRKLAVIIEDNVTIGAGAVLLPGIRLGAGCVVAAGAVVTESVTGGLLVDRDGSFREVPLPPVRQKSAI